MKWKQAMNEEEDTSFSWTSPSYIATSDERPDNASQFASEKVKKVKNPLQKDYHKSFYDKIVKQNKGFAAYIQKTTNIGDSE